MRRCMFAGSGMRREGIQNHAAVLNATRSAFFFEAIDNIDSCT